MRWGTCWAYTTFWTTLAGLLYSGTNGMVLTGDEATVARYFAHGIRDGVR